MPDEHAWIHHKMRREIQAKEEEAKREAEKNKKPHKVEPRHLKKKEK